MPSSRLILCRPPLLLLPSVFPASESFPVSQIFSSGGQSIGASASASVPPVNFQGWFPLRWTGLISCTGSTPLSNSVAGAEIRKWAATLALLVFPLTLTIIKMISLGPLCPLASYLLSRPLLSCSHFFPHFCVCSHCPLLNNHWNIPITYIEDFKKLFVSHARPFILWLYLMQQLPFPVSTRCPLIGGFLLLRGVQPGHIVSFALRCFPSDGTQVAQWWRVHLQCKSPRRCRFDPWVGKFPWRRARQPTPVFLPGESRGQRSLAAYSP